MGGGIETIMGTSGDKHVKVPNYDDRAFVT